jgi:hypothetical protein
MRPAAVAAVVAGVALAAGCGTPSADLFEVQRSGSVPGARLKLLVTDGGRVRCNDGRERDMGSDRLLDAREIARELRREAEDGVTLRPGPNSVYSYRVRLEDGIVRFSDTSPGITPEMRKVQALTRSLARGVCGLVR